MFTFERRNHYKTGVYGAPCVRVPVDTPYAADKISFFKKGFKFERFDVFFHLISDYCMRFIGFTGCKLPDRAWNMPPMRGIRRAARTRGREAIEMGALPSDRARLGLSSRMEPETLLADPRAPLRTTRTRLSLRALTRLRSFNLELESLAAGLRLLAAQASGGDDVSRRTHNGSGKMCRFIVPKVPLQFRVEFESRKKERGLSSPSSIGICGPIGSRRSAGDGSIARLKSSAAQPLHYQRGKGWDDCSPRNILRGEATRRRRNERK